ncbi:MAG: CrcB family protein [Halobacteriales archaeon]
MAVPPFALVGVGGAVGAVLRHAVGELVPPGRFRLGTVTVNVAGTFALAALTFAGAGDPAMLALGTGACGAFTTFSSFSIDAVELYETDGPAFAAVYAVGTLLAAGAALGLAWLAVRGLP